MRRGCEGKGQLGAARWEVGEGGRAGAAACITAAWHGLIGSIGRRRRQHPSCCYTTKCNVSNLQWLVVCHLDTVSKLKAAQPFHDTALCICILFPTNSLLYGCNLLCSWLSCKQLNSQARHPCRRSKAKGAPLKTCEHAGMSGRQASHDWP